MRVFPPLVLLPLLAAPPLVAQVPVRESITAIGLLLAPFAGDTETGATDSVRGRWSLAVGLPSGGGADLGLWWLASRQVNLGLTVGVSLSERDQESAPSSGSTIFEERTTYDRLQIQPSARVYLRRPHSVAPFLQVHVGVAWQGNHVKNSTTTGVHSDMRTFFGGLGLGAEWFPVSEISFSAWTGLRVAGTSEERTDPSRRTNATTIAIATLTSALTLQVYF